MAAFVRRSFFHGASINLIVSIKLFMEDIFLEEMRVFNKTVLRTHGATIVL